MVVMVLLIVSIPPFPTVTKGKFRVLGDSGHIPQPWRREGWQGTMEDGQRLSFQEVESMASRS